MELYVQDGPGLRLGLLGTSAERSRLATGEAAPKAGVAVNSVRSEQQG